MKTITKNKKINYVVKYVSNIKKIPIAKNIENFIIKNSTKGNKKENLASNIDSILYGK